MATESIVQELIEGGTRVMQPDYIYTETDPFERITSRLDGLDALTVIASCALEADCPPTKQIWESLWLSLSVTTGDIKRDLYALVQERTHG